jgi:hypothetical protein
MYRRFQRQFILFIPWAILCLFQILTPISFFQPPKAFAAEPESREYIIKAGFIYNFTKFVKWPNNIKSQIKKNGINLCVIGKDPFGLILENTAENLLQRGKVLNVKRGVSLSKIPQCTLLFISQSEKSRLAEIVTYAKAFPVLLIGDTSGYAEGGVGINFFIQNNKIHFEINNKAVKLSGLKISSELLGLARIVEGNN